MSVVPPTGVLRRASCAVLSGNARATSLTGIESSPFMRELAFTKSSKVALLSASCFLYPAISSATSAMVCLFLATCSSTSLGSTVTLESTFSSRSFSARKRFSKLVRVSASPRGADFKNSSKVIPRAFSISAMRALRKASSTTTPSFLAAPRMMFSLINSCTFCRRISCLICGSCSEGSWVFVAFAYAATSSSTCAFSSFQVSFSSPTDAITSSSFGGGGSETTLLSTLAVAFGATSACVPSGFLLSQPRVTAKRAAVPRTKSDFFCIIDQTPFAWMIL